MLGGRKCCRLLGEERREQMKIVVIGSTGGTGLAILQQAIQRRHQVIAFARDPKKISISDPNLAVVQGDALDPNAVKRAVDGADAVISALGVRLGQSPGTLRSDGTRNIVDALLAVGVNRFVTVSTIGVGDSRDRLSLFARFLLPRIIGAERMNEAERQEQIIRQADLRWTILRPPRLVDSPIASRYTIGTDLKTGLNSKIARADLATALLDQLESDQFVGKCPSVVAA